MNENKIAKARKLASPCKGIKYSLLVLLFPRRGGGGGGDKSNFPKVGQK